MVSLTFLLPSAFSLLLRRRPSGLTQFHPTPLMLLINPRARFTRAHSPSPRPPSFSPQRSELAVGELERSFPSPSFLTRKKCCSTDPSTSRRSMAFIPIVTATRTNSRIEEGRGQECELDDLLRSSP